MTSLSISQAKRPLRVTTPLGDALVAVSLTGEEEVSQPFLFVVDFVSTNASVSPGTLLGKAMTLHIPTIEDQSRPIHGLVRRFSSVGRNQSDDLSQYRVEMVPALWFMSLSSDCRTFENVSALDIVEKVCKAAGASGYETKPVSKQRLCEVVAEHVRAAREKA